MLLADDAVIRKRARDARANDRFGGPISGGHRIVAARPALVLDRGVGAKMRQDRRACRQRQAGGELQIVGGLRHRGTIETPASFSCASISEGTYFSPNPSRFAITRLWCTASPMIAGTGSDSAKCV